jgi:hypothetical protein
MKLLPFFGLLVGIVLLTTGCGVFGDDDGGDGDEYNGDITVGLTDVVPASGTYTLKNVFPPGIREILAVVQLEDAEPGTEVRGDWFQLGTLQIQAEDVTPHGALISSAGFELTSDTIDSATGRGGGRLRLVPNAPLPPDSYVLRVYVDDKLARTVGFVVQ